MPPKVSVIIVVKNDPGIRATLNGIAKQQGDIRLETIVIDASGPDRLAGIRRDFPKVTWEMFDQKGKRLTITQQRNRGLELARGEIIVFIDANCRPAADWLASLVGAMDDGEKIVTGPCRPSNAHNLVHYIQEHDKRVYVPECTTINVAVAREVANVLGGFDKALDYGEDVDFFWRATRAGYKICYEPGAAITHDYGQAAEQLRRAYRYGKSRAILHAKHWRDRWPQLLGREPHVWAYPLFILGLPLACWWPQYLLLLLIPLAHTRSFGVVAHHFVFGLGVIAGTLGLVPRLSAAGRSPKL